MFVLRCHEHFGPKLFFQLLILADLIASSISELLKFQVGQVKGKIDS